VVLYLYLYFFSSSFHLNFFILFFKKKTLMCHNAFTTIPNWNMYALHLDWKGMIGIGSHVPNILRIYTRTHFLWNCNPILCASFFFFIVNNWYGWPYCCCGLLNIEYALQIYILNVILTRIRTIYGRHLKLIGFAITIGFLFRFFV